MVSCWRIRWLRISSPRGYFPWWRRGSAGWCFWIGRSGRSGEVWCSWRGLHGGGVGRLWEILSPASFFVTVRLLLVLLWGAGGGVAERRQLPAVCSVASSGAVCVGWSSPVLAFDCLLAAGSGLLRRRVRRRVVDPRSAVVGAPSGCSSSVDPATVAASGRWFVRRLMTSRPHDYKVWLASLRSGGGSGAPSPRPGGCFWRVGQGPGCDFLFSWGLLCNAGSFLIY